MKPHLLLMILLAMAVTVFAQTAVNVVVLVASDTETDIQDNGITITTNITTRYTYGTLPALPQISYQSSLGGYATNAASVTISNDIAQDVSAFYQRTQTTVGNIQVLMP